MRHRKSPAGKLSIRRAFNQFKPKMDNLVAKFCRRFPMTEFEEIQAQASYLFVKIWKGKFNPAKCLDINCYFSHMIWKKLVDQQRIIINRLRILKPASPTDTEQLLSEAQSHEEKRFSIKKFAAHTHRVYRQDIRRVLYTLFEGDFLTLPSPTKCRVALMQHLKEVEGWNRRKIETTFDIIRDILSQY